MSANPWFRLRENTARFFRSLAMSSQEQLDRAEMPAWQAHYEKKRPIAFPVNGPVGALVVLSLLALAGWGIYSRLTEPPAVVQPFGPTGPMFKSAACKQTPMGGGYWYKGQFLLIQHDCP